MKTEKNYLTESVNEQTVTDQQQRMTSLEIARLTGKQHKDVLKAIRNMEDAWEKTCGRKFALTSRNVIQPNGGTREIPCYSLTKTETLYIATKFINEAAMKVAALVCRCGSVITGNT